MSEGELVPADMSANDLREEVNLRTSRAGHTTRAGGRIPLRIMVTSGWGATKLNVWPRDEHGNLIQ